MALKNKLLIVLSVLVGFFILIIIAGILFLYRPDFFLSFIFDKKPIEVTEKKEETKKLTEKELFQMEEIVINNLSLIKEGVTVHPAIIFKTVANDNSTDAYVITLSELEWPFVKAIVKSGITLDKVKKVYRCSDIFIVNFDTKGMVVPPVKSEPFVDKGVIVPGIEGQKPIISPFYGDCQKISGLVFNQFGDFSGICKNQDFVPASWINNLNLSTCSIIYNRPPETENATSNNTSNVSESKKENEPENNTIPIMNKNSTININNQTTKISNQTNTTKTNIVNYMSNQTE